MAATTTETRTPLIEDRTLAILAPDMVPEEERPTLSARPFWYQCDWETVHDQLMLGRIVVLSVESGDCGAALVAVLYEMGGDVVWRHDVAKGRLYVQRAKAAREAREAE